MIEPNHIDTLFQTKMSRRAAFVAIGVLLLAPGCAKKTTEETTTPSPDDPKPKPKQKTPEELFHEGRNCQGESFCHAVAVLVRFEKNGVPVTDPVTGEDLYYGFITDKSATLTSPEHKHRIRPFARPYSLSEIEKAERTAEIAMGVSFDTVKEAEKYLEAFSDLAKIAQKEIADAQRDNKPAPITFQTETDILIEISSTVQKISPFAEQFSADAVRRPLTPRTSPTQEAHGL